jgi:hypothetical protein
MEAPDSNSRIQLLPPEYKKKSEYTVNERIIQLDVRTEEKHRSSVDWSSLAEPSRFSQNSSDLIQQ